MEFQRYGIKIGRLWIRRPFFKFRSLMIGLYVYARYWEMGEEHQVIRVQPLPCLVLEFDWTLKR